MHPSVMAYVADWIEDVKVADLDVLEVGSYNENGSVRILFPGANYMGVDVRPGPGVDRIADGFLPFPEATFDLVVSTETLEHDRRPWETIVEMRRVVRPRGMVILTARGFDGRGCYPLHGADKHGDYWRFTTASFELMAYDAGLDVLDCRPDPDEIGVFLTARKP